MWILWIISQIWYSVVGSRRPGYLHSAEASDPPHYSEEMERGRHHVQNVVKKIIGPVTVNTWPHYNVIIVGIMDTNHGNVIHNRDMAKMPIQKKHSFM